MKYILTESQYRSIILSEGRKEELLDKYKEKFEGFPALLIVLNNDVIKKTNYKYADFLLKELHPNSSKEEIDEAIELINNFDKYQKNLDKKDINDYKSLEELENVIILYLASKGEKADVEKIYENDRFLVIIPKNEEASCKYGANTRWCVTSKGTGHFERYTSGKQLLYFIIDKKNSTDFEFSKVAIHIGTHGDIIYYDSQDKPLTDKEIRLLNYAIHDVINAIKDDYDKKVSERTSSFLDTVFSEDMYDSTNFRYPILGTDKVLLLKLSGFESETPGKATAYLDIFLYDELYQSTLIDKYTLYITYKQLSDRTLAIEVKLLGTDDYIDNFVDTELLGEELWYYPIQFESDEKTTAKKIREIILGEIHARLVDNDVDVKFIEKTQENY
jgi:hypothetical protein